MPRENKHHMFGKTHTEKTKIKMIKNRGHHSAWNKGLKGFMAGEKHWKWNNGVTNNKEYRLKYKREYRHRKGISKRYISKYGGILQDYKPSKILKKRSNQAYKRRVRLGGRLTIEIIQNIYEDNIKKYGTLTCYLCFKPIIFRDDSIDHKIPLSRGGTNARENLAIAHRSCNSKKHTRTLEEYKKEMKNDLDIK